MLSGLLLCSLLACEVGPTAPAADAPIAALVLRPEAVSLRPGQAIRFSAETLGDDGRAVAIRAGWEATGGVIDGEGRYVAGAHPGLYQARAVAGGETAIAVIVIEPAGTGTGAPPSGVPIFPGQSIQAAVDAHPPGTAFVIKTGVHVRQSVEPRDGMTFVGEPGTVLDGDGLARFAFGHYGPGSREVTIRGLEIRNYMTRITQGAIQGDNTRGWTVEGNEIHHNGGFGVRGGHGMRVLRNHAHHNGDAGIHGYLADGMLVEGNEVDGNGAKGIDGGARSTAAGMKFFRVRDLVVRGNHVHHNTGRGIWTDTDCIDVVIEGNRVVGNSGIGIWHEIGYRAVIRGNHVEGNGFGDFDGPGWLGGAGIAVSNASDVEVYDNTVVDNADGIAGMQAASYPAAGAYGPYVLRNLRVYDNRIVMRQGRTGIVHNVRDDAVFTSLGNRFERNRYTLGAVPRYFAWRNGSRTEAEWRAYGHDVEGTFARSP